MSGCDQLVDLLAKLRLMEAHYHEDMNEVFDKLELLDAMVQKIGHKVGQSLALDTGPTRLDQRTPLTGL